MKSDMEMTEFGGSLPPPKAANLRATIREFRNQRNPLDPR
jgi:hypothetical protein